MLHESDRVIISKLIISKLFEKTIPFKRYKNLIRLVLQIYLLHMSSINKRGMQGLLTTKCSPSRGFLDFTDIRVMYNVPLERFIGTVIHGRLGLESNGKARLIWRLLMCIEIL